MSRRPLSRPALERRLRAAREQLAALELELAANADAIDQQRKDLGALEERKAAIEAVLAEAHRVAHAPVTCLPDNLEVVAVFHEERAELGRLRPQLLEGWARLHDAARHRARLQEVQAQRQLEIEHLEAELAPPAPAPSLRADVKARLAALRAKWGGG